MSFFSGFGIGDALGSLFGLANTGVNIALQNKQNKFNAEQAQLNRNFQREMWSANNEYNTPTKQVARLVDAGLNPALAYGQVTSGTSSSSPSGSQAQSAGNIESGLANAFGLYATAQQLKMQKQQTDADIKVKAAQAKAFDSEAEKN